MADTTQTTARHTAHPNARPEKELKGRHVLIIALCAFGVIITANMALLFAATGTFPGTVVDNSYRAGVGWNDRAAAQAALGWQVSTAYDGEALRVTVLDAEGAEIEGLRVEAVVGRPAGDVTDTALTLTREGAGYGAPVALAPGSWRVALSIKGGEGPWQAVAPLWVPKPKGDAG
ncbi:MAG: FixH family protein [Pseudomonadota bacterium]